MQPVWLAIFTFFLSYIISLSKTKENREGTGLLGLAHRISISIHSHREVLWPYFSFYVLWALVADSLAPPAHISYPVCPLTLSLAVTIPSILHVWMPLPHIHAGVRGTMMRMDKGSFLTASKFKDRLS